MGSDSHSTAIPSPAPVVDSKWIPNANGNSTPTSTSAPQTQRAYVLSTPGGSLTFTSSHPVPNTSSLKPHECLVRLTHTGVCHTDLGIRKGEYPAPAKSQLVGGHEGVGVVVALGVGIENGAGGDTSGQVKVGDRVGVKLLGDSCLNCEMCRRGWEAHCPQLKSAGVSVDGTFAEYVVTSANHVTPIPDELDGPTAAAIMCAGVTVYSALQQANVQIGDWVVIPGAGGGLGHLAIQYAVAMGLRVIAIDTGASKRSLALSLGATVFIDFRDFSDPSNPFALIGAVRKATGGAGAHAAIVTAGGAGVYEQAVGYLRPRGALMMVGIPPGNKISVDVVAVLALGLTIRGVFLGNRQQAIEAVNIAASGKVKCMSTIRPFSELEQVYEDMEQGKIVGRVVLEIEK